MPYRAQAVAHRWRRLPECVAIIEENSSSDVELVCTAVGGANVNLQSNSSVTSSVNVLRLSSLTKQVLP